MRAARPGAMPPRRGVAVALCAALLVLAAPFVAAAPLAPSCFSASSAAGADFFPDKLSFSTSATEARGAAGSPRFGAAR